MKRKPSCLKKFKLAPAGLVGQTSPTRLPAAKPEPTIILVPPQRLQCGLWNLPEGDIHRAYTADQKPNIRKPFEHEGQHYANWGGSERDVCCTPLFPLPLTRDTVLPARRKGSYAGEIVTWKGQSYVCGEDVEFRAAPRGPSAEIDLARRMYAYGGYFATKAGTYRKLMKQWAADDRHTALQRRLYAMEAAADLPQTQAGMRLLLGDAPGNAEPPRFNPWTGQTAA